MLINNFFLGILSFKALHAYSLFSRERKKNYETAKISYNVEHESLQIFAQAQNSIVKYHLWILFTMSMRFCGTKILFSFQKMVLLIWIF